MIALLPTAGVVENEYDSSWPHINPRGTIDAEKILSEHRQTQLPTVELDEIAKHTQHCRVTGYGALGALLADDLIWIERSPVQESRACLLIKEI
jgi:hypothetical protein